MRSFRERAPRESPPVTLDAVGVLNRILPLAAAARRGVRTLGLVALAAAVVIASIVAVRWTPNDAEQWGGFVVLCVLLALPAAVLLAFSLVLGEVVGLPDKLRSMPSTTRAHAQELRAIAHDAQAHEQPLWRRLPASMWRLAMVVRSAPDLLAPHASLLPLFSVPFQIATLVSALLVPVLVIAALGVFLAAAT